MTLNIARLAELEETPDFPDEYEQLKLAEVNIYLDRLYVVNNHEIPTCKFCDDFTTKLVRASCGCLICHRCLYTELASIPLARCPYCSFKVEYDKYLASQGVQFNHSPLSKSVESKYLSYCSHFQVAELYPVTPAHDENAQIYKAKILCRFHNAISPYRNARCTFCCPIGDDQFTLYKEHVCNCQNRAEQHVQSKALTSDLISQDAQAMYQIRQDLLLYSKIDLKDSDLFYNKAIFNDPSYIKVPAYRAVVIPHLFVKKLLLEESDSIGLKERADYWNLYLIVFRNPVDPQDLRYYRYLQLELCAKAPDNSTYLYQFKVPFDYLEQEKVLRYFARVRPTMIGRYSFEVRMALTLNSEVRFLTRKVYQKCVQFYMMSENPQMHFLYQLRDRLRKDVPDGKLGETLHRGVALVDTGCDLLGKSDEDTYQEDTKQDDSKGNGENKRVMLSLYQLEDLITFGSLAISVRDCLAFIIAIHGFAKSDARGVVASGIFEIVAEHVDRYAQVYLIEKAFVDLIYEIVQNTSDFNILTLKFPGLFGRLRRAKALFNELSDKVDELLNALFRVVVKGVSIDGDEAPPEALIEKQEAGSTQYYLE